jgi:hypothetical protein
VVYSPTYMIMWIDLNQCAALPCLHERAEFLLTYHSATRTGLAKSVDNSSYIADCCKCPYFSAQDKFVHPKSMHRVTWNQ